MLLLVQGATSTLRRMRGTPGLGVLISPVNHNSPAKLTGLGYPMAADNGAFSGIDERAFTEMLGVLRGSSMLWVTALDVVGDATATLKLFDQWEPVIREAGQPVALVSQDGLTTVAVPWERIDCLFVGGTDKWKLSPQSVSLCREAKRLGKWVHVGRVNSLARIRAAMAMGADSVDGSQFSWWPDRYIPKGLAWIRRAGHQLSLGHSMFGECPKDQAFTVARRYSRPGPLGMKRIPVPPPLADCDCQLFPAEREAGRGKQS